MYVILVYDIKSDQAEQKCCPRRLRPVRNI